MHAHSNYAWGMFWVLWAFQHVVEVHCCSPAGTHPKGQLSHWAVKVCLLSSLACLLSRTPCSNTITSYTAVHGKEDGISQVLLSATAVIAEGQQQ